MAKLIAPTKTCVTARTNLHCCWGKQTARGLLRHKDPPKAAVCDVTVVYRRQRSFVYGDVDRATDFILLFCWAIRSTMLPSILSTSVLRKMCVYLRALICALLSGLSCLLLIVYEGE